ncbi:MAG: conjugal transfer protein TraG N-terminal domain-containing protein, partial [Thermoplasmata archaeon]
MFKKVFPIVAVTPLIFFALHSFSYATTFFYNVYGPPLITYNAFNSLSLWLSDNSWSTIVYAIIGLSVLFGVLSGFLKAIATGKGNVITSVYMPFLAGLVIYAAFISNQSQLQLMYQPNGGYGTGTPIFAPITLPTGIAVMADFMSDIESGLINIISTSGNNVMSPPGTITGSTPTISQDGYSWISFDMLNNLVNGDIGSVWNSDPTLTANLRQYISDCLTTSILNYQNNGVGVSPQSLMSVSSSSGSDGWLNILSQAANPAINTTQYSNGTATTVTCQAAWTSLNSLLTNMGYGSDVQNQLNYVLQVEGYDTSNQGSGIGSAMYTQGQNALVSQYNFVTGQDISASQLVEDLTIANMVRDVVLKSGNQAFTTMTNYNNINSSIGTFSSLNYYLPVVKVFILAIIVGVTGILLMLVPTPFVGRAVEAIFGLWLWYTLWMISDILVSVISTNAALSYLIAFKQNGTGLMALYQGSGELSKILGLIGTIRGLGIGIAGVISSIITRSSAALVGEMVAGHLQGQISTSGSQVARMTQTPQGEAQTIDSMQSAAPSLAFANQHSFMSISRANLNNMAHGYGSNSAYGSPSRAQIIGAQQTLSSMGNIIGAYQAYENAVEDGYQGSFSQWIAEQSKYQNTNLVTQAQAMQELANKYFGGDLNKEMNYINQVKAMKDLGTAQGLNEALKAYEANDGKGGLVGMVAFNENLSTQALTASNKALQDDAKGQKESPYNFIYDSKTGQLLKEWAGSKVFIETARKLGINPIIIGMANNMIADIEKGVTMGNDAAAIGQMEAYQLLGELNGLGGNPSNAEFLAATNYA